MVWDVLKGIILGIEIALCNFFIYRRAACDRAQDLANPKHNAPPQASSYIPRWGIELVLHIIQVPLNGLWTNLPLQSKATAVWVFTCIDFPVNEEQP
jgi:hypothetical protein